MDVASRDLRYCFSEAELHLGNCMRWLDRQVLVGSRIQTRGVKHRTNSLVVEKIFSLSVTTRRYYRIGSDHVHQRGIARSRRDRVPLYSGVPFTMHEMNLCLCSYGDQWKLVVGVCRRLHMSNGNSIMHARDMSGCGCMSCSFDPLIRLRLNRCDMMSARENRMTGIGRPTSRADRHKD